MVIWPGQSSDRPTGSAESSARRLSRQLMIAKMAKVAYDAFSDPAKTEGLRQAAAV